jgi:hypothetical protein
MVKIMKIEIKPEDKLILSSIKIHPSPEELEQINILILQIEDWNYLISNIIDRGIAPLLFNKLPVLSNSSQIPESVKNKLEKAYYKTFSRSTILYEHFRKIAEVFTLQNIPLIALKGIYLSECLYQDIGLRQFSDIDLLVKEEDALTCLDILANLGYKPNPSVQLSEIVLAQIEEDIVHYSPMILNGVSIEIHIKLHVNTPKYNVIVAELWSNAQLAVINGFNAYTLNNYDLLIHLCLHLDKHFWNGKVQFTCFNDITNILEGYSDSLIWNKLLETCQLYKCENIVFKYIILVNKYMNAYVPANIIQKYFQLLTEKDEYLFCNYLKGNKFIEINSEKTLSKHFSYLKKNQTLFNKVRYLRDVLFPSTAFMIYKYKIKHPSLVLFYYPFRYYIGVMGVMNYFKKKVVGRE